MVRTRFAPSPTGYMHIGNLRTALNAYLFGKAQGGKSILQIEDTGRKRNNPQAPRVIYNSLQPAYIDYDEGPDIDGGVGPYVQSQRKAMKKRLAFCCSALIKNVPALVISSLGLRQKDARAYKILIVHSFCV